MSCPVLEDYNEETRILIVAQTQTVMSAEEAREPYHRPDSRLMIR